MPDILRVTTPLVNKAQVIDTKRIDSLPQYNLQDVTRVNQASPDAELLMQNNGMFGEDKATALLLDMLKDPAVAVAYLRNISLLHELFDLLPANNRVLSEEIEEMFTAMMLPPEELAGELQLQENGSTHFKGELFDILRGLLETHSQSAKEALLEGNTGATSKLIQYSALQKAVVDVLKTLSAYTTRGDNLGAVANNLEYLANSLAPSRSLSEELLSFADKLRQPGAASQFETLKKEIMALFDRVEDSILFTSKLGKVISIATYNLSRYSGNVDALEAALDRLFAFVPQNEDRETILSYVADFVDKPDTDGERSKVLDKLVGIINKQVDNKELLLGNGDRLEKIVQSLLSSPSNFTPLLHYILPVQYHGTESFMEIWINPNGEEDAPEKSAGFSENYHMFLVFDVKDFGRFNMELFVHDKLIDFSLFCPPAYTDSFAAVQSDIGRVISSFGYKFGDVRFAALERDRSLMEVFRSLPYKRTGVDVKV